MRQGRPEAASAPAAEATGDVLGTVPRSPGRRVTRKGQTPDSPELLGAQLVDLSDKLGAVKARQVRERFPSGLQGLECRLDLDTFIVRHRP